MSYSDEQFEQILDDALHLMRAGKTQEEVLNIFPEYADELRGLLDMAYATNSHFEIKNAQDSFKKIINHKIKKNNPSWAGLLFQRPFAAGFIAIVLVVVGAYTAYDNKDSQENLVDDFSSVVSAPSEIGEATLTNIRQPAGFSGNIIKDEREFLKIGFVTEIKTRDVEETASNARIIVRGYGGRIDSYSVNESRGSIHFVIPKIEMESFKKSVIDLVGEKLTTFSEDGSNLLSTKISLENDRERNRLEKIQVESRRDVVIAYYDGIISTLNTQIARAGDKSELLKKRSAVQSEYALKLTGISAEIEALDRNAEFIAQKEKTFSENVETVSGTIIIEHASVFGIAYAYLSVWWVAVIIFGWILYKKTNVIQKLYPSTSHQKLN